MKCLVIKDFTDEQGIEHKENETIELSYSIGKVYMESSFIVPDRSLELENQTMRANENMMIRRRWKGRVLKTGININR